MGREISQEEYDELTPEEQNHGTYFITNGGSGENTLTIDTKLSNSSQNPIGNKAVGEQFGGSVSGTFEPGAVAASAHAVGEYFMWIGQFVRTTTAIAIGDTISLNTNVTATNVAAVLTELNSKAFSWEQKTYTTTGDFLAHFHSLPAYLKGLVYITSVSYNSGTVYAVTRESSGQASREDIALPSGNVSNACFRYNCGGGATVWFAYTVAAHSNDVSTFQLINKSIHFRDVDIQYSDITINYNNWWSKETVNVVRSAVSSLTALFPKLSL